MSGDANLPHRYCTPSRAVVRLMRSGSKEDENMRRGSRGPHRGIATNRLTFPVIVPFIARDAGTCTILFPSRTPAPFTTMQFQEDEIESESLLPPPATHLSAASRSKLAARRYLPSEKAKGKQRALETDTEGDEQDIPNHTTGNDEVEKSLGRHVTIVFANESESGSGNLEMWVEEGESVGSVKEQVREDTGSLVCF